MKQLWIKFLCLVLDHKPTNIWCGDEHCESVCVRCKRPILGNHIGEWWVDRRSGADDGVQ